MNTSTPPVAASRPRLIPALSAGFSAVAAHIYLILFPIALDLLLWFGPRVSIRTLMSPILTRFEADLLQLAQSDMRTLLTAEAGNWRTLIDQFNLVSALRSYPVGIPSLLATQGSQTNPLGISFILETPNAGGAFSLWLLFGLAGLTLGSYFFNSTAHLILGNDRKPTPRLRLVIWQTVQSILLLAIILMVLLMISVPVVLLVWLLAFISPALLQLALLLMSIFTVWLLLPMFFSPHGIFAFQLDALRSTLISYQFVRFFLPGAGLFILTAALISQGMDILWRVPPDNSWMLIIGIAGHAFVSTALVVSSFVYYNNGIQWMREILRRGKNPDVPKTGVDLSS